MDHEDEKGKISDHDIVPEDEKRKLRTRSLRRKAMNGPTSSTRDPKKPSKQVLPCQFASISTEEFLDEEKEKAVTAFRKVLIERDLLPAPHDDYHNMLRYSCTSPFPNEILILLQVSFVKFLIYFFLAYD